MSEIQIKLNQSIHVLVQSNIINSRHLYYKRNKLKYVIQVLKKLLYLLCQYFANLNEHESVTIVYLFAKQSPGFLLPDHDSLHTEWSKHRTQFEIWDCFL